MNSYSNRIVENNRFTIFKSNNHSTLDTTTKIPEYTQRIVFKLRKIYFQEDSNLMTI